ncbi:hypothetical protein E2P81_ATG01290 [Venturia nashicola]|uniref:Uncharacterized protein n=1 Tax=Venturia nashicola TaxID=86259 RepID=A0A4Z1PUZ6_9PEZI|nr:hypothetical protein E6O75_ATG01322 [Venturia nashicola]TLD38747.1 hypothetical protein E2P81_ATG01290 [Venturia nashicola]
MDRPTTCLCSIPHFLIEFTGVPPQPEDSQEEPVANLLDSSWNPDVLMARSTANTTIQPMMITKTLDQPEK